MHPSILFLECLLYLALIFYFDLGKELLALYPLLSVCNRVHLGLEQCPVLYKIYELELVLLPFIFVLLVLLAILILLFVAPKYAPFVSTWEALHI